MSTLSRKLMPAVWVIAIAVVALAAVVGSGRWRTHAKATSLAATPTAHSPALTPEQRARVHAQLEALPLAFEANQGQLDPQVKYMARGNGYTVFLTPKDTVFAVRSSSHASPASAQDKFAGSARKIVRGADQETTSAVFMKLVGANPQPQIVAGRELPGYTNYYIGNDRSKWQTGIKQYAGVSYHDIYPGVDMAFHGQQRQLEFDFIVAPGAKSYSIAMGFTGEKKLTTDNSGNLILSAEAGDVLLHKPVAYQERNGKRELVDVGFQVKSRDEVAFALGAYDHSRELVIDPSLSYAMFLGGNAEDEAFSIAVDASGNAYVAGQTASSNFPSHTGTVSSSSSSFDAFVTRIGSGTSPDFTTLIGGTGTEAALGVYVNSTGAYVVGTTDSTTFASTTNIGPRGGQDVFVAKLNSATGVATYITRIGGGGTDTGNAIAVDASGNAYIGGETTSSNFPTVTTIQPTANSTDTGFVAELNAAGTALTYSTYLGGSTGDLVTGIALDSSNNAYVTGITVSADFPVTTGAFQTTQNGADDAFVTEVKSDGSALVYSTFLGGSGADDALGIAVDAAGKAYVTGDTTSSDFPTANAAQTSNGGGKDVFVTKLTSDGTALLFSTYYGGTLDETGTGIALDLFGDAYVTGRTASSGFAVSGSPFQASLSGTSDAFILELSNTGFTVYASFLGGTGVENSIAGSTAQGAVGAVAVDSTSNAYMAGATSSGDFPLTSAFICCNLPGGGLADGFVAKVGAAPADFSVAASPATISTTSGTTTAAITVTVSSVNSSYGQAVTLSCGSLPSKAVCHFSPTSVTPGDTAVTSSLTIATNGAASASLVSPASRQVQFFAALLMPFVGLVVVGAGMSSQRKRFFGLALLALVLGTLLMLPACGGGSGGGGGGGGGNNTPPGNYNITVTGSGGGGASHSAAVALTVN